MSPSFIATWFTATIAMVVLTGYYFWIAIKKHRSKEPTVLFLLAITLAILAACNAIDHRYGTMVFDVLLMLFFAARSISISHTLKQLNTPK